MISQQCASITPQLRLMREKHQTQSLKTKTGNENYPIMGYMAHFFHLKYRILMLTCGVILNSYSKYLLKEYALRFTCIPACMYAHNCTCMESNAAVQHKGICPEDKYKE